MIDRGFTLVELLVALVAGLFVAAGALVLAAGARTAFTVEPAALDTVRRLREGADAIGWTIAGAGGQRDIGGDPAPLSAALPVLQLSAPVGDGFGAATVARAVQGGRGRLVHDQPGPAGSLTLDTADGLCPRSGMVCGFSAGDVAIVFDGRGHFDTLIVGAVSTALARITPRAPLAYAYPAGAWVVAARVDRLALVAQAGGGQTLVRMTAAGAREPVLDGVTRLAFRAWGEAAGPALVASTSGPGFAQYGLVPPPEGAPDREGIFPDGAHCMAMMGEGAILTPLPPLVPDEDEGLVQLTPGDLDDGPWCPHDDAVERFDADWFRVRRVDVELQVEVLADEFRGPSGPLFARGGNAAHDAPRWVRDRAVRFSVAVPR